MRDDQRARELAGWTARMRATGHAHRVALDPLDAPDTARLAEAITGRPLTGDDASLLQATTGGFPLYVVEAARSTVDLVGGPLPVGDLTAVLRSRLEQVDPARAERGRTGRRGRAELHPRPAHRGERPRRRQPSCARSTSCGAAGSCARSATATTSPTTCSATRRTRRSARRSAGCCTGASPRASSCCTPTTRTPSRPSSPSSTPAAGAPGAPSSYYRRAADVAACMFAHAEAIRLHKAALSIVRALPEGARPDQAGARRAGSHGGAAQRAGTATRHRSCARTLERSIALAESLGRRDSTLTGLVGLWASGSSRATPPPRTGRRPARWRWWNRDSELSGTGALRLRRVRGQPGQARRGAASPRARRGTRQCRLAERRHPAGRARQGLRRARPLAARPRRRRADELPLRRRAGPHDRQPVQPGGGAGLRRVSPTSSAATPPS